MSSHGDPSLWQWVAGTVASIGSSLFGYHKYMDAKKADKQDIAEIKNELNTQRGHIAKVFDRLNEAEGKNEERHRELLMHLLERKRD